MGFLSDLVGGIFGGGPSAPPPDYESLWKDYIGWSTEDKAWYTGQVGKTKAKLAMQGARPDSERWNLAVQGVETEYEQKMAELKSGATYSTLKGYRPPSRLRFGNQSDDDNFKPYNLSAAAKDFFSGAGVNDKAFMDEYGIERPKPKRSSATRRGGDEVEKFNTAETLAFNRLLDSKRVESFERITLGENLFGKEWSQEERMIAGNIASGDYWQASLYKQFGAPSSTSAASTATSAATSAAARSGATTGEIGGGGPGAGSITSWLDQGEEDEGGSWLTR